MAGLWQPSGLVHFVVGPHPSVHETTVKTEDGKTSPVQRTFQVQKDVLMELSPVVKAAVTGEYKERATNEIMLPQFDPDDFELFIRLAQSVAFSNPPEIGVPIVNDSIVLRVVPIAAYLGVEAMLKMMEEHVQNNPSLVTIVVFEETRVQIQWRESVFIRLFEEVTTPSAKKIVKQVYTSGAETSHSGQVAQGLLAGYTPGRYKSPAWVPATYHSFMLRSEHYENLAKLSVPTSMGFMKVLIEHKCMKI
eukprot:CAMPEP_0179435908 /NCGR_PEP_ID=MMETSP0799-20121207/19940_1 /TAXON_ID=46947 /ORGANISM="Geminigera cryophila, Strain CCMP2564" /LENGTH=248 /DNA_ID=CAMNT_0021215593 /DNA_START=346 /DNA_END=1092 /DNA_ORIENTATION=+